MNKYSVFICLFVMLLCGCKNDKELQFIPSSIHNDFPVPAYAKLIEDHTDHYVLYEWEHAEEIESIHNEYFIKIIENGWEEITERQQGVLRVFTKDDTIVELITRNGYFTISILVAEEDDVF